MNIKKGDNVIVITGKDKGKTAKVLRAFPSIDKILVEGVNLRKKHVKARKRGDKGQVVEMAFPMHVSNVQLVGGNGKRVRGRAKDK